MRVKEESEKAGLKLNIQKSNIMASGHITSPKIDGEKMEKVADFIFLGSKITAHGDCSHEIKRCLLLGRKVMTNLGSILKSRDFTFCQQRLLLFSHQIVSSPLPASWTAAHQASLFFTVVKADKGLHSRSYGFSSSHIEI